MATDRAGPLRRALEAVEAAELSGGVRSFSGIYGVPSNELADGVADAIQLSPTIQGSTDLADIAPGSLGNLVIMAPPGTLERRAVLAGGLNALAVGGALTALAPKDKGGSRIAKELAGFGCSVEETSKSHHRICTCVRPPDVLGIDEAIAAGGPQVVPSLGLWSQPGIFSWDRIDPGSALLAECLPQLAGAGADLGCGYGFLARAVLASPQVTSLALIDNDRRAIAAARRNTDDPRATFRWQDVRSARLPLGSLDFVVMNPPFHDGGAEDKGLGQDFIRCAAQALKRGGTCWLTANRHLPYEAVLKSSFATVTKRSDRGGYKVLEAVK